MKKRTRIDFSRHQLIESHSKHHHTWFLKRPNSYYDCIRYTIIDGVTVVTGDYGNWIFCRSFYPNSKEGGVSDGYWIEKLCISSTQEGEEWDSEATKKQIQYMIDGGAVEYGYRGEKLEEYLEYLNGCLERCDEHELDYTGYAYREYPSFMDAESVIFIKDTKYWLKAVFDGFEEICQRIKVKEEEFLYQ